MNERIHELAGECEGITICECGHFGFNYEKFAELIIRECAKVADLAEENKCEWIGGNILTHFGIKSE